MSLGKNVKQYRKQRGLTQHELAQKANLSRSYLADVEADRYNPSVDTLKSIAEALNIGLHVLLGEERIDSNDSEHSVPEWATKKDVRDFKKMLEEDPEIMFDGVPLDEEDREKIKRVMEAIFWDAKKKNKRKPIKGE